LANTGSGGLSGFPTNGAYDSNIALASWAHQGGRGPFLSYISTYSGNAQWIMIVPLDDGSLWRSTNGGQTITNVLPATSAPAGARPQHAVRLPNGAIYVAYAPTSNDVGLYCNASFNFTQPTGTMAFDPRYKVLRSGDDGVTWEDTGLSTINGISAAGSQVEVNWGGWEDTANVWGLVDFGVYTWTDTGLGNPWSSITVNVQQTQVGIQDATMMWTESFRSGGTATDNFLGSTLTNKSIYETACGPAGTCGGVDNTQDDLFIFLGPSGSWTRNYDWQGFNHCSGGDTATEPSRGGSVTAWDNPSQGISLNFQAQGGVNYPSGMGLFNAAGTNVGPGGNSISGYQHSVSSTGGFFATTYDCAVYVSGDKGADWAAIPTTVPGPVDPTGNTSFPGGTGLSNRILLANLNSSQYSDNRLIALTQDTVGATAKGTTRIWVYSTAPTAPTIIAVDQTEGNASLTTGNSVCNGDTVILSVSTPAASSYNGDGIVYQWQNQVNGTWTNIPGAVGTSYTLMASSSNAGNYQVLAIDSLNGTELLGTPSNSISFSVLPSPGFTSLPQSSQTVCPGVDQVLTYRVSGPAGATYLVQVFEDGTPLSSSILVNSTGATPATITLDSTGFATLNVCVPGSRLFNNQNSGLNVITTYSVTLSAQ
jgi:hypothetical protein